MTAARPQGRRFGHQEASMSDSRNDTTGRFCAAALSAAIATGAALAEGFDQGKAGMPPPGWTCGSTGGGSPVWLVRGDPAAPSPPNVLLQSGKGRFPWCVMSDVSVGDGFVEVMFKPIDGREDQAGGVVWRWKDADNYYVARANALENNVSLYYTEGGRRLTLKYVDAPVPPGRWSVLRVEFSGRRIKVLLNGKAHIDFEDSRVAERGAVGVWTKADSVTAFDNFSFGKSQPLR
jgi:hypothetical protein